MPKRAFTSVASYYDVLMKGIEYREWIEYTINLFKRAEIEPERILDLACGTGSASLEFLRRGYQVVALDKSRDMLEILKNKKKAHKLEIMEADMKGFKLAQPVQACTCYFDSVNYLLELKDLAACFKSVSSALTSPGIFVFDMNTIYGLEKVWGTNTIIREIDHIYSVWKSVYDATSHMSTLYLTMFVRNGSSYKRVDEVHQERAYPMTEVKELLADAGFNKIEIFAHMTTSSFLDISSRVMVVAEKRK